MSRIHHPRNRMTTDHPDWRNKLYSGDNLALLREHIPEESVELVYLDV
jgi:site-specific DNA-methyltransferase (adenine-specific)